MFKNAIAAVWVVVIAAACLWGYLDQHSNLRFLPAAALVLGGMLLTDAMEIQRTGIAAMRHRPDIRRDTDPAGFRTQLRVQYAAVVVILGMACAVQVWIVFC